jgi:hypothetical protein
MSTEKWVSLLNELYKQQRTPEEVLEILRRLPYEDLLHTSGGEPYARLDHHRSLRTGVPEVVFGLGKTPEQVVEIVDRLVSHSGKAMVTRASAQVAQTMRSKFPRAFYDERSGVIIVGEFHPPQEGPFAAILTAGTADIPVAEEAALALEWLNTRAVRIYDVGVAGIHRLLDKIDLIRQAYCVIAVAGMEGALATVVGGLVACPVIAVPTSIGYGAGFQGLAPLLSMLNSCIPGVAVVNIDNGFGAGVLAHMIGHVGQAIRK